MSNANKKSGGLGRGLSAIFSNNEGDILSRSNIPLNSIAEINISDIETNPFQPRHEFDEGAIQELAESIRIHGVIQPITVRKIGNDKFELISGERRTRACKSLGLKTIPAYIRLANDQSMLEMALIENIHRENLNPIEVALSYQRLIDECSLRQEDLAERVGKNRATIANFIRLLKLPSQVQIALRDGTITPGQARPLLSINDEIKLLDLFEEIIDKDLSARAIELLVKTSQKPKLAKKQTPESSKTDWASWETKIKEITTLPTQIKSKPNGKAQLIISLENEEELQKFLALINQD